MGVDVPFASPSHGDVLQLVVQLTLLLGLARLLGELSRRLGQPAVVGEILAGVLLGPSVLGTIAPDVASAWLPSSATQAQSLETVALLGAILLLTVTGLETDLGLIRRRSGVAAGVAMGGLVLPFGAGFALGWWFPSDLIGDPDQRLIFALFLATAMAVSAIPVLATILLEMGMMRREVGQTMLAAGMVDDLMGWAVLGVIVALGDGGGFGAVGTTVVTVVMFVAITALVGPRIVTTSVRIVHSASTGRHRFITLTLVLVFGWAAFSQALHLEPVIGAFAMGILLGRVRRLPVAVGEFLEALTFGVFAPIFFAVAGLKVDLVALADGRLASLTVAVIVVAVFGKVVGAYLGGRWLARADRWTSLAYGIGLSARGAIGIVVASIGLSLEILNPEVFSMIVVMAVVTSLLTPSALKAVLQRVVPGEEEATRLRREKATAGAVAGPIHRVLVPLRSSPDIHEGLAVRSALLERLAGSEGLAVTVISVTDGTKRSDADQSIRRAARRLVARADITTRLVPGDPVEAVVDEAAKGYDLVILGASRVAVDGRVLFETVVDEIVRMAPVPTLVVSSTAAPEGWQPQRILVPTDGTAAARRAADLAFALSQTGATVTVLHVVPQEVSPVVSISETGPIQQVDLAHQIVGELRSRGETLGIATATMVEAAGEPDVAIVEAARRLDADLVVLGTSARSGTERLYLGPRVERILAACPCPVAVLNS